MDENLNFRSLTMELTRNPACGYYGGGGWLSFHFIFILILFLTTTIVNFTQ